MGPGPWPSAPGDASLPLALSIVSFSGVPSWSFILWASISAGPRRWRSEHSWLRLVFVGIGLATLVLSIEGAAWAKGDLIGPDRFPEQDVVFGGWAVQQFAQILCMGLVARRWRSPGPSGAAILRAGRITVAAAVLLVGALAAAAAALGAPARDGSPSTLDLTALAASLSGTSTLVAAIITSARRERQVTTEES